MTGHWGSESVAGHPCDVYTPPRINDDGFVLLYLHGYHMGSLREQTPYLQAFDRHGLPVVCPVTRQSWWTDRRCPAFDPQLSPQRHILDNVLPFMQQRWGVTPPRIGLFGTSMGGQGALRLAYQFPDRFPVVAAIAPAIDFHHRLREGDEILAQMYRDVEDARQDTAILHIHPLNWPRYQFFCCDPADGDWFDSADRLRMKLMSLGVPFEYDLETTAGGHGFGYYNRMADRAIDYLASRLRDRQRQLL